MKEIGPVYMSQSWEKQQIKAVSIIIKKILIGNLIVAEALSREKDTKANDQNNKKNNNFSVC